ncbi:hypothetical protein D910_00154 [Dendroctonus ponderosae]|uniref:Uncharacterized protein n=1 Tax=Dendroctonus ponderosae TaxID=77166 RepID=U4UZ85_DENPD|nr:hypothetical protein D910_00154 [Dendroctonus ponderosae]
MSQNIKTVLVPQCYDVSSRRKLRHTGDTAVLDLKH